MQRIAVVGAGGLGGFLGALLARAGHQTVLVVRSATSASKIRDEGLNVRSEIAGAFNISVEATNEPGQVGVVDVVLFCVKTYDIEEAAAAARPLVGPATTVVPVQNGVDSWERIGRIIGRESLIGGIAYLAAAREPSNLFVQRGRMRRVELGAIRSPAGAAATGVAAAGGPESSTAADRRPDQVAALLSGVGIEAAVVPDIDTARWTKFVMVCATGGVMALSRLPLGPVLAVPETRQMFVDTLDEVHAVALRLGVRLADDVPTRLLDFVEKNMGASTRSSQLDDLLAGRRLELDSLNGKVVELGGRLGVATPMNQAIYAALKPYSLGRPSQALG